MKTYTRLNSAVRSGNIKTVQKLIARGEDINDQGKNTDLPIVIAVKNKHTEIIKYLIKKKADLNSTKCKGLVGMVGKKNYDILELLLRKKADPNQKNLEGKRSTPLLIFLEKNYPSKFILKLLRNRADPNTIDKNGSNAFDYCKITNGDNNSAKYLLKYGTNINHKNQDGNTPLMVAADKDNLKKVKWLIDNKASINELNNKKRTAFLQTRNEGVMKLLLDSMACIDYQDRKIRSHFEYAMMTSCNITLKMIDSGVGIDYKNKEGENILTLITKCFPWRNNTKDVEKLIDAKVDLNSQCNKGRTPLMNAVLWGCDNIARLYLKRGADISVVSNSGCTTEFYASFSNINPSIEKLLRCDKTNLSTMTTDEGKTALVMAVGYKNPEKVKKFVLEKTCDPNIIDNDGNNVLTYALEHAPDSGFLSDHNTIRILSMVTMLNNLDMNVINKKNLDPILIMAKVHKYTGYLSLSGIIRHGSKMNKTYLNGETVFIRLAQMHAERNGRPNLINEFKKILDLYKTKYGKESTIKSLDTVDNNGNTVLHVAAEKNLESFITEIMKYDVNINIKNNKGKTASDMTKKKKIIRLLQLN